MKHHKAADIPRNPGPAGNFTGAVTMQVAAMSEEPGRHRLYLVTFPPGARMNWHTHEFGQTLYILSGRGRVVVDGGPVVEIEEGDVVNFAPGERHWHGAAPDAEMRHLAIVEAREGKTADWEEPVSNADYGA